MSNFNLFSACSHTVAIAFKLNIFPSYIEKAERRNSNQAVTNAVNFGKQEDAGKKQISVDLQAESARKQQKRKSYEIS